MLAHAGCTCLCTQAQQHASGDKAGALRCHTHAMTTHVSARHFPLQDPYNSKATTDNFGLLKKFGDYWNREMQVRVEEGLMKRKCA